tara:strand:+ start:185 stop:580 length:396 start_codon:yes stop_codon:yes gene_type:complete
MTTYIIYQRTNVDSDRINAMPTSTYAKAYFALGMPSRDTVEDAVSDGLFHNMYQPTMIMQDTEDRDRTPFEAIFDEGNGYGDGSIKTANIRDRCSMSVGDILVQIDTGYSHICMPVGWHSINLTLELTTAA